MIAKGTPIPHGADMINYAMTKEKAVIIRMHNLPADYSPESVWAEMKLHQRMTSNLRSTNHVVKNGALRFEISPQNKETDGWSPDDYRSLIDELNEEMKLINYDSLTGEKRYNFDLDNTQYIAAIHYDSKGGIRHIHLVANRIDMDGQVIDAHDIGRRLVRAVHAINVRHGWELPEDIHNEHLRQINEACMDILQRMPCFDWDMYGRELAKKGLRLKTIKNKAGEVVAYNIFMGNSKFKASSLGTSRNLTVKNIEKTWNKFHFSSPSINSGNAAQQSSGPAANAIHVAKPEPMRVTFHTEYDVDGKKIPVSIPMEAYDAIRDECREGYDGSSFAGSVEDVIKTGVLLFIGSIDAATTLSANCGGGGSQPDSGWGRDPKEDEREWARRCARMALQMARPVQRTRSFRR